MITNYLGLPVVSVQAEYDTLSDMMNNLNSILMSYPRYNGSMVMVNDETEDKILDLLNKMIIQVDALNSDYVKNMITDDEAKILKDALDKASNIINENMAEVEIAKAFLLNYTSR